VPDGLSEQERAELLSLYRTAVTKLWEADDLTHQGFLARKRAKRAIRRYDNRRDELSGQLTIDDILGETEEVAPCGS